MNSDQNLVRDLSLKALMDTLKETICDDCGATLQDGGDPPIYYHDMINVLYDAIGFRMVCPECHEEYQIDVSLDDAGRIKIAEVCVDEFMLTTHTPLDGYMKQQAITMLLKDWDAHYNRTRSERRKEHK